MATHGRGGLRRWLLGSVAEEVVRADLRSYHLLIRADGIDSRSRGEVWQLSALG